MRVCVLPGLRVRFARAAPVSRRLPGVTQPGPRSEPSATDARRVPKRLALLILLVSCACVARAQEPSLLDGLAGAPPPQSFETALTQRGAGGITDQGALYEIRVTLAPRYESTASGKLAIRLSDSDIQVDVVERRRAGLALGIHLLLVELEIPSELIEEVTAVVDGRRYRPEQSFSGRHVFDVPPDAKRFERFEVVWAWAGEERRFTFEAQGGGSVGWWPWLLGLLLAGLAGLATRERLRDRLQGSVLEIVDPPRYCLIDCDVELTALQHAVDELQPVHWRIDGVDSRHRLSATASPGPVARHTTTLLAGPAPRTVTIVASTGNGASRATRQTASADVAIWKLEARPYEPNRRLVTGEPDAWQSFDFLLAPREVVLSDLLDAGEVRILPRAADGDGVDESRQSYAFAVSRDASGVIGFGTAGAERCLALERTRLRWNGCVPANEPAHEASPSVPQPAALAPGLYTLELTIRQAQHTATTGFSVLLDDTHPTTDLAGYWRVHGGPADGWLMQGFDHGEGQVSLATAPGVAIGGRWRSAGNGSERPADFRDAVIDLTEDGAVASLPAGELDELVQAPAVLAALEDGRIDRDYRLGRTTLSGKPSGIAAEMLSLGRTDWRIEILPERTTHVFDPGATGEERETARGLVGGNVARIRFERFDGFAADPLIGTQGKGAVARLRVLDESGTEICSALTQDGGGESLPDGPLTVDIENRTVHGEGVWTGLDTGGNVCPSAFYTLELTVRDGMAEQTLSRSVFLGTRFDVLSAPDQFAPEHETVEIEYEWLPREDAPLEIGLTVSGANGEAVFSGVCTPEPTEQGFRVTWTGRDSNEDPIDWPRIVPLRIELAGTDGTGMRKTAEVETTVVPIALSLIVDERPPLEGQEADWYGPDEIPADVPYISCHATVTVRDSAGQPQIVKRGVRVKWEFSVESADNVEQPRPPAFLKRSSAKDEALETTEAVPVDYDAGHDEGRSALRFRPPARAPREDRGTRTEIAADRFSLQASLVGMPELSDSSREFTIGPGRPKTIRRLGYGEIRALFHRGEEGGKDVSDNFDFVAWDDVTEYTDNFATMLVDAGSYIYDSSMLGFPPAMAVRPLKTVVADTLRQAVATEVYHPIRFIGVVRDVPFRSLVGEAQVDVPVFLAGYAGQAFGSLRGGQALLVLFDVSDAFGNPIPVTGPKKRRIETRVRVSEAGKVPPFVIASATGDTDFVYGGREEYSPFGPATDAVDGDAEHSKGPPLGIHGRYYVAGIQPFTARLGGDVDKLNAELANYGEQLLAPPPVPEIDDALSIVALVNGRESARLERIRLVESGSLRPPPNPIETWGKWLLFGEVEDFQTLRAELTVSVIPFVGDGRDIVTYLGSWLILGREKSKLDNILLGLSVVGLIGDVTSVSPVGMAFNVFAAAGKALVKWTKTFGKGRKVVGVVESAFDPLMDAVKAATANPTGDALNRVAQEVHALEPLMGMVRQSATSAGGLALLRKRLETMAAFLDDVAKAA